MYEINIESRQSECEAYSDGGGGKVKCIPENPAKLGSRDHITSCR
jgi:hypothetical protein